MNTFLQHFCSENSSSIYIFFKDFGPVMIAAIAAFITAYFAYRNWRVSRDKLKLDLFDKRFKIYQSSVEFIRLSISDLGTNRNEHLKYILDTYHSRFLFDSDFFDYINSLVDRDSRLAIFKSKYDKGVATDEDIRMNMEDGKWMMEQFDVLNKKSEKFLRLQH